MPGDVLFVPPVGETITVMGAVTRPAIYELQNSADVAGALGLAGAPAPTLTCQNLALNVLVSAAKRR